MAWLMPKPEASIESIYKLLLRMDKKLDFLTGTGEGEMMIPKDPNAPRPTPPHALTRAEALQRSRAMMGDDLEHASMRRDGVNLYGRR